MMAIYRDRLWRHGLNVRLSSAVAVVDKIPGEWLIGEQRLEACEGMSLMVKQRAHPDQLAIHLSSDVAMPKPSSIASDKAFLEFLSSRGPLESALTRMSYRLPLANTLFVNGRPHTLFQNSWKKSTPDNCPLGEDTGLERDSTTYLNRYGFLISNPPKDMEVSQIPLVPLTEPRLVENAMGNIIREIRVHDKVLPASTELETAVMKSVKRVSNDGGVIDPTVRIYALIIGDADPDDAVQTAQHEQGRGPDGNIALRLRSGTNGYLTLIKQTGARLHRVIGGGGGWGNRQGLLALDPAGNASNADSIPPLPFPATNLEDVQIPEFASPNTETTLAKRGQTIQFFQLKHNLIKSYNLNDHNVDTAANGEADTDSANTTPTTTRYPQPKGPRAALEKRLWEQKGTKAAHIVVGTVPTIETVESVPSTEQATTQPESEAKPEYIELPDTFGALSEGAIEAEMTMYPKTAKKSKERASSESNETHSGSPEAVAAATATAIATRNVIDVPYSYIAFLY
jgi:hypothetical protein